MAAWWVFASGTIFGILIATTIAVSIVRERGQRR